MRKHAINQFLGQTTIDPSIERAFQEGHILDVLYEFDLEPDLIRSISAIQTASFDEFLVKAYLCAMGDQPEPSSGNENTHPLKGLHPRRRESLRPAA